MGTWRLETFKMGIYVMFPIAVFWGINQIDLPDQWITAYRNRVDEGHLRGRSLQTRAEEQAEIQQYRK